MIQGAKAALTEERTNPYLDPEYSASDNSGPIIENCARQIQLAFNRTLQAGDTITLYLDSAEGVEQMEAGQLDLGSGERGDWLAGRSGNDTTATPATAPHRSRAGGRAL